MSNSVHAEIQLLLAQLADRMASVETDAATIASLEFITELLGTDNWIYKMPNPASDDLAAKYVGMGWLIRRLNPVMTASELEAANGIKSKLNSMLNQSYK